MNQLVKLLQQHAQSNASIILRLSQDGRRVHFIVAEPGSYSGGSAPVAELEAEQRFDLLATVVSTRFLKKTTCGVFVRC